MLYHKIVGFPANIQIVEKVLKLRYTRHALGRLKERIIGKYQIPTELKIKKTKIVQADIDKNGKIKDFVFRTQFNKKHDIIFVLKPSFKKSTAKVITVWFNHKKDNHRKIDQTKFIKP